MATKLTIPQDITEEQVINLFKRFEEETNVSLYEHMLSEDSSCGKYEYIYLFMNINQEMCLLSVLNEVEIKVTEKQDFTEELLNIVNNNKTEEFKQQLCDEFESFDFFIEKFIYSNVNKDHVLDKMLDLGKEALTEQDMSILRA